MSLNSKVILLLISLFILQLSLNSCKDKKHRESQLKTSNCGTLKHTASLLGRLAFTGVKKEKILQAFFPPYGASMLKNSSPDQVRLFNYFLSSHNLRSGEPYEGLLGRLTNSRNRFNGVEDYSYYQGVVDDLAASYSETKKFQVVDQNLCPYAGDGFCLGASYLGVREFGKGEAEFNSYLRQLDDLDENGPYFAELQNSLSGLNHADRFLFAARKEIVNDFDSLASFFKSGDVTADLPGMYWIIARGMGWESGHAMAVFKNNLVDFGFIDVNTGVYRFSNQNQLSRFIAQYGEYFYGSSGKNFQFGDIEIYSYPRISSDR